MKPLRDWTAAELAADMAHWHARYLIQRLAQRQLKRGPDSRLDSAALRRIAQAQNKSDDLSAQVGV